MLSPVIAPDLVHYPGGARLGVRNLKRERVLLSQAGPMLAMALRVHARVPLCRPTGSESGASASELA
jgi:hypothetical protein